MDKATQRAKIFEYCQKHGSITVRDAFNTLSINSPTKRISEMRKNRLLRPDHHRNQSKRKWRNCAVHPVFY